MTFHPVGQEKKKLEAEVKAQVEENNTLKEEKAEVQWKLSQAR